MNGQIDRAQQDGIPKRAFGRALTDLQNQKTPSRLLPGEDRLLAAVVKGERCAFVAHGVLAALDGGNLCLLAHEETCKNAPVRAEFLRFLALGGDPDHPVHERGIQLLGAYVIGLLDLYECEVKCPISFLGCWFEKAPNLRRANSRTVSFRGSRLPGLDAAEAAFGGSLYLDQGFRSHGAVQVQRAYIGGALVCEGGQFQNFRKDGALLALAASNAKIAGAVTFHRGFRAAGQVSLLGAEIHGELSCTGGKFLNRTDTGDGFALVAQGAKIEGSIFLNDNFLAEGRVWLRNAEIGGSLDCRKGKIINRTNDGQGITLAAIGAKIRGYVFLTNDFAAEGRVSLRNAEIGGDLDCNKGKIVNRTDDGSSTALDVLGSKIRGNVFLTDDFFAEGRILLRGTEIGGDLDCRKGKIINRTDDGQGTALDAIGAKISGYVYLTDEFFAEGRIRLRNAEIGGDLDCSKGKIVNRTDDGGGTALDAEGARISGYAFLDNSFSAEGKVLLRNAEIGEDLDCKNGKFANRTSNGEGTALDVVGAKVRGNIFLIDDFYAQGRVWLRGAEIARDLDCRKGKIVNRTDDGKSAALEARGAKIGGYVFLSDNFAAEGSVVLDDAKIGVNLDCSKGQFVNFIEDGQGYALSASGAEITGSVSLDLGFRAEGKVDFIGANVGRQVSCAGGYFSNPAPAKAKKKQAGQPPLTIAETALELQEIKVGDVLFLGPPNNHPDEHVTIRGSLSLS